MKSRHKKDRIVKPLILAMGMFVLIIALPMFVLLNKAVQGTQQLAAGTPVSVTVDPSTVGTSIPPAFMGISSEAAQAPCEQNALEKQNPTLLESIFKNLGPGTFRIGGESVEDVSWSTTGDGSCSWSGTKQTPGMVNAFVAIMKKVGWKFIWGLNLKNGDPANNAQNAAYVARAGGSSLIGFEIGNEPNLYGWSYSQYQSAWEAEYTAVKAAGDSIPVVGPAGIDCCSDFYTPFIHAEGSKIVMATDHYYPTTDSTTFGELLSPSLMQNGVQSLQSRMQLAHSKKLRYQLGETNAVAHVPPANIGNAFGQSLWILDYAMRLLGMGASGMNVHGWSADNTSILYPDDTPRPTYYGMLAFHYAAPNGQLLPVHLLAGSVNLTAYAVKTTSGDLNVLLINKDLHQAASVHIDVAQDFTQASAIRLSASSVTATTGITLGGSAVASNGSWSPKTIEPVTLNGANATVTVPAVSAVIITYKNSSRAFPSSQQLTSGVPSVVPTFGCPGAGSCMPIHAPTPVRADTLVKKIDTPKRRWWSWCRCKNNQPRH